MIELAILIGLQASGKSSFYRRHLAVTHALVSKDLLRNNRRPARRQTQLVTENLTAGRSVAVDNTNVTVELRKELIDLGHSLGATVTGYYLAAKLADCLTRNAERTGKNRVPDVGLFAAVKALVRPAYSEGFDRLFFVGIADGGAFDVRPWVEEEASRG
ncbi:ATP-binding protein [Limnoglobus roseus]|uniref:ATP-binding protein n=1 Tax=Limnoglobus roseus TaxID=2598579 RepID=A0A5C1AM53_9BACT|nr:ATP-binding protein [Limnoglobus roseus]QEL19046.1 ATP-binding protein [Limnoglobus roseus]